MLRERRSPQTPQLRTGLSSRSVLEVSVKTLVILLLILALSPQAYGDLPKPELSGIEFMVLGDEVYEVADTYQLTHAADGNVQRPVISPNGKMVAFCVYRGDATELCFVPADGGRVTSVRLSVKEANAPDQPPVTLEPVPAWSPNASELPLVKWTFFPLLAWSSDSRFLVMVSYRFTGKGDVRERTPFLLVTSPRGEVVNAIGLTKDTGNINAIRFSPNGQQLAFVDSKGMDYRSNWDAPFEWGIGVVDVATGAQRHFATPHSADRREFAHWSADGRAVYYIQETHGKSEVSLHRIEVATGADQVLWGPLETWAEVSPDGALRVYEDKGAYWVRNNQTGASLEVARVTRPQFLGWAPSGRAFCYTQDSDIKDHTGGRSKTISTLWLAGVESHPANTLCLAVDSYPYQTPTWSADSLKIAYVRDWRLHVTELKKHRISSAERAQAGLRLSEEDEKRVLMENGQRIGKLLANHVRGFREFPKQDLIDREIGMSLYDKKVLYRPGTDTNIFRYLPPKSVPTDGEAAATILGELDAGYNWLVAIYADGHAEVISK